MRLVSPLMSCHRHAEVGAAKEIIAFTHLFIFFLKFRCVTPLQKPLAWEVLAPLFL